MSDGDRSLRGVFDAAAARYAAARPRYPSALFDELAALAGLRRGASILEIGCGPGIATRPLAERGYRVQALELGRAMAGVARRDLADLPNVQVEQGDFETWEARGATFDLVCAATAWHWLDPAIAYPKAAALLNPGGALAFWEASHAFPVDADPFFEEIQAVYDEIGEGMPGGWTPPPPDAAPTRVAEIEASGRFRVVGLRRYVWAQRYTADQYVALLDTFSGHISMAPDARAHLHSEIRRRLARRPDGSVLRHWLALLRVARPR
ncbi:MAG: class I SAM-dependent methyltransferase [Candidatus Dormibacteraceae bacterium]